MRVCARAHTHTPPPAATLTLAGTAQCPAPPARSHTSLAEARPTWGGRYYPQRLMGRVFPSEEELTLTRENSIRRLHSHHTDPRSQSEEPEGRSYSTLTTVREIETQTELLSPGSGRAEEEDRDEGIKQAMNHFVQENGTLRAKPTGNGIYINGRGHLV
uniref:Nectin cell adhesion molecule 4 n=1 Tax=Ailuropoda melanoleuca TaxID=9646 RepID=A0A7N5JPC5_AILME